MFRGTGRGGCDGSSVRTKISILSETVGMLGHFVSSVVYVRDS